MPHKYFLLAAIVLAVSCCVAQNQKSHGKSAGEHSYLISPADQVQILVEGEPSLTRVATVEADGSIAIPLLGRVQASGLTAGDLGAILAKRFREFVQQPTVNVTVVPATPGETPLFPWRDAGITVR